MFGIPSQSLFPEMRDSGKPLKRGESVAESPLHSATVNSVRDMGVTSLQTQAYRILVVDDDPGVLSLFNEILCLEPDEPGALESLLSGEASRESLREAGLPFALSLCATGDEALEQVRAAQQSLTPPFSVAFIDIRLDDGSSGVSVGEQIRKLDPNIEIVFMTAYTNVTLKELNLRVPPPEKLLYLQKPFRPLELRQLAQSLCAKWLAETQYRDLNTILWQTVEERTSELNAANQQLKKDIAERQRMLEELRVSEVRFRHLFEDDITGNFAAGPDGSITACNESFARIFGYADARDAKVFDVLRLRIEPLGNKSLLDLVLEHKRLEHFEASFQRRDNTPVHVIGNIIGNFDAEGKLTEIRGYFFDVTDRKRLEEQLRLAQKMEALGTLAGGIAHDFNNILGVIMGYAEILQDEFEEGTSKRRRLDEILKASNRARDLVTQILNFSRQGPQERKPVKIAPLLKETLKLMRSTAPASVEIRTSIHTGNDTVSADPAQMHQIILNLCANAIHAMRETGGTLHAELTEVTLTPEDRAQIPDLPPGNYIRISISDTGHGIEPEVLGRIFDPFFTTKKPGEGTGMGLSVVHGIVNRHHGTVLVESRPGEGTTFNVYLPRSEKTHELQVPEIQPDLPGGLVLLVDDEQGLVDIGKEMLENLGYSVVGRSNSVEALEVFRKNPEKFDLVITDLNMPILSGFQLAKQIMDLRPEVPIILCTGFSEVISMERAREIGIRDFVMKPLLREQLAKSIRRALASD